MEKTIELKSSQKRAQTLRRIRMFLFQLKKMCVRKMEREKKSNDKYKRIERMISPEALNYTQRMEFSHAFNSA